MRSWENETLTIHWPTDCLNVKDRVILDLGCGLFGWLWHEVYQFNTCTTSHWLKLGAKKVIGFDPIEKDINWLNENIKTMPENFDSGSTESKSIFFNESIVSTEQIKNLILKYNADIIKSDVEGAESFLLDMSDEDFSLIKEYYVETHSVKLFDGFLEKFKRCGYTIRETMEYSSPTPNGAVIRLIFAFKNEKN